MHRKSLAIEEELGNWAGMAQDLGNIGNVLKDQGDWEGATIHFRRSLTLAEELSTPEAETIRQALANAEAYLARGPSTSSG